MGAASIQLTETYGVRDLQRVWFQELNGGAPRGFVHNHSSRSVIAGSIRAARHVGCHVAMTAVSVSSAATVICVTGSAIVTP